MIRSLVVFCAALAVSSMAVFAVPPAADPEGFDEALAAFDSGDYSTARETFRRLADQGHVKSQYNLGLLYFRGLGVPSNLSIARTWALKAANKGYAPAEYTIGAMYSSGQGFDEDLAEAAKWFRRAAEQGHGAAQHDLASLYGEGRGLPRDSVLAYYWYSMAIQNLPAKQKKLARQKRTLIETRMGSEALTAARKMVANKQKQSPARK